MSDDERTKHFREKKLSYQNRVQFISSSHHFTLKYSTPKMPQNQF